MIFKIPLSREGLILLLLFPQTLNTRFRVLGEVAEHDQHSRPKMESRPYEFLLQ